MTERLPPTAARRGRETKVTSESRICSGRGVGGGFEGEGDEQQQQQEEEKEKEYEEEQEEAPQTTEKKATQGPQRGRVCGVRHATGRRRAEEAYRVWRVCVACVCAYVRIPPEDAEAVPLVLQPLPLVPGAAVTVPA
eukprot:GHVU01190705.1.p2 GENE.GHVU01190705.1~~GHVU01190705.1.p2  ORF type:complete len:137 (-),score=29.56 GHVU01190705.1:99-509(-)